MRGHLRLAVHPDNGTHPTYLACDVLAGTASVADADDVDAVEWVPIGELARYVPDGFYPVVQEHLDAVAADS